MALLYANHPTNPVSASQTHVCDSFWFSNCPISVPTPWHCDSITEIILVSIEQILSDLLVTTSWAEAGNYCQLGTDHNKVGSTQYGSNCASILTLSGMLSFPSVKLLEDSLFVTGALLCFVAKRSVLRVSEQMALLNQSSPNRHDVQVIYMNVLSTFLLRRLAEMVK